MLKCELEFWRRYNAIQISLTIDLSGQFEMRYGATVEPLSFLRQTEFPFHDS